MTYAMTYRQALEHGACDLVDAIGEILGGWDDYGGGTPVTLVDVLDMSDLNEDYPWCSRDAAEWALYILDRREARRLLEVDYPMMSAQLSGWGPISRQNYQVFQRWYTAHLRMVLGGRIRPGYWRAGKGWS